MDSSPLWRQFNVHIASRLAAEVARRPAGLLAALRHRDVIGRLAVMWQHLENVKNSLLELSDEDAPRRLSVRLSADFSGEAGMTRSCRCTLRRGTPRR